MKEVTREWLREYFRYEDGNLFAIKARSHSKVIVGDKLGYLHKASGRIKAKLFNRKYGLHQLVWIYFNGPLPEYGVDHKDRNPINNRIENLRACTAKTNAENQDGVRGLTLMKSGSWRVQITHFGKVLRLGTFKKYEDALKVRQDKEKELFEFSPLNEENNASATQG